MTQPAPDLYIRDLVPGEESAFRRLNEEWICRYFTLEPKDIETLADPQTTVLDGGGRVFLAFLNGQPVGCCALLATSPGEYEVVKMAVTESVQRGGIGRRLLERTIAEARAAGATRLHLETNNLLATAVHLYESLGFRHIPPERITPSPYARANIYMELFLEPRP